MIGQHATAGERGIEPPVDATLISHRRRLGPERLPAHAAHLADRALREQFGRALDDRRVVPVVNGVEHAPALAGQRRQRRQLFGRDDERLLAEHVPTRAEGGRHQRAVAGGRRADVHEVEPLPSEQ